MPIEINEIGISMRVTSDALAPATRKLSTENTMPA